MVGRWSDRLERRIGGVVSAPQQDPVEALIDAHGRFVYRVVVGLLGEQEAEDVTQEVFLRACAHLGRFEGRSSERTWLYSIARNLSISWLRKETRRRTQTLEPVAAVASGLGPEALAGREEERAALLAAIQRLPLYQREVVVLRGLVGLPFEEVARILKIKRPTAESRMARAKVRLRELLGEGGGVGS